jgi:hypothetical protein
LPRIPTSGWITQKAYKRSITRLDQIPDEELDKLADWVSAGCGDWLWERSTASARIKQLCGNPEAIASAYSLKDYRIADELGGEAACQNLRDAPGGAASAWPATWCPTHGHRFQLVVRAPGLVHLHAYSPFPRIPSPART